VTALVSTDCTRLYEGIMHMHNVWTTPLEAIAIIALALYITSGIAALPTLWILIIVIPLQCACARMPVLVSTCAGRLCMAGLCLQA